MGRTPRYAYAVAIFLGLLAASAPAALPLESLPAALLATTAIFGFAGLLLAALWPLEGWKWGLWVVAPGFLLVTVGLFFSGELASFLGDDLPFLVTGLIGSCIGGATGTRLRGPRGQDSV